MEKDVGAKETSPAFEFTPYLGPPNSLWTTPWRLGIPWPLKGPDSSHPCKTSGSVITLFVHFHLGISLLDFGLEVGLDDPVLWIGKDSPCGCFQKLWYPKMDGENNGNPYSNGWFGGTTIFGNTHVKTGCATKQEDFIFCFGTISRGWKGVRLLSKYAELSSCIFYLIQIRKSQKPVL